MNNKQRVLSALQWKEVDVVPFVPKIGHVPRDLETLARLKELGMGLSTGEQTCTTDKSRIETEEEIVGDLKVKFFHTPYGDLSMKTRLNLPGEGGERGTSWIVERMFKGPEDYNKIKYLVENHTYKANYSNAVRREKKLGENGVLFTSTGYSPLMQLIVEYMGFQRFAIEIRRHPEQVEDLMDVLDRKFIERVHIVANSPIKMIHVCGNIDGVLVNPKLFEKYIVPRYQIYNEILHKKGKITMTHMDGRLKCIKDQIKDTKLDVVQAFTPPPGGDLPIREARSVWGKDLAIWVNIPEMTFLYEPKELEEYVKSLLLQASPGDGLVLGITETVPPKQRDIGLEVITRTTQKYGKYPIPPK